MIVDFSNILLENSNVHVFNPSIAHWKNDLYLCVYRRFVRYSDIYSKKNIHDYTADPLTDPNHPWLGGDRSTVFWKTPYGYDNTHIVLLKINGNSVVLYKKYTTGKNVYNNIDGNITLSSPNDMLINGVDARLLYINKNKFIVSYNVFIKSDLEIKRGNCINGCGLISMNKIELNKDGSELTLYQDTILCPDISNYVEKNWSFWKFKNDLYFSYQLYPSHEIFKLSHFGMNKTIKCTSVTVDTIDCLRIFRHACNYIQNNRTIYPLHVSVTTPAIQFTYLNLPLYIGIGHIKYNYEEVSRLRSGSCDYLNNITTRINELFPVLHPVYIYLMFFYIFDGRNGLVKYISNMFIPYNEKSKTGLFFPSGITKTNDNKFLLSYGDSDSLCKYIILDKTKIESMCYPTNDTCASNIIKLTLLE